MTRRRSEGKVNRVGQVGSGIESYMIIRDSTRAPASARVSRKSHLTVALDVSYVPSRYNSVVVEGYPTGATVRLLCVRIIPARST